MHVIFDLDGVLLDSESDLSWLEDALDATLRDLDLPVTPAARERLGPGRLRSLDEVAASFGVDPDRLWRVRNRNYTDAKLAAIERRDLEPFPDVARLEALRPAHDLHVISNSPQSVVDAFVAEYGLEDRFDVRIGRGPTREDLAELKPDGAFFHRFCERVEAVEGPDENGRYVYVGDTEGDREFARNVGIEYVHLARADAHDGDDFDFSSDGFEPGDAADPTFETLDAVVAYLHETA